MTIPNIEIEYEINAESLFPCKNDDTLDVIVKFDYTNAERMKEIGFKIQGKWNVKDVDACNGYDLLHLIRRKPTKENE